MALPRRRGQVPATGSEIIDFYFDSLTSELETADDQETQQPEQQSAGRSRSSSFYSTDTLKEDKTTPLPDTSISSGLGDPSLRQVFRNLCQVGLHIANLRHARDEAHKKLEEADQRADSLAHELVLKRLDATDQIDSSNQAISQVTDILVSCDTQARSDDKLHGPADSDTSALREAVHQTRQLKTGFYSCRRKLEAAQRVLLWPTLEQWRMAVDEFRKAGQHRTQEALVRQAVATLPLARVSGSTIGGPPSLTTVPRMDGLDRVTREIEILLPQLGRHRLEHLLGYITAALQQGEPKDGNYIPSFI